MQKNHIQLSGYLLIALTSALIFSVHYLKHIRLKNTAHAKPIGIATNIAIAVTRNVPHISGNIPNLGFSKNGNHSFSVKKGVQ